MPSPGQRGAGVEAYFLRTKQEINIFPPVHKDFIIMHFWIEKFHMDAQDLQSSISACSPRL